MAVKKGFDQNDITIPFPIRTLDFSMVDALPEIEEMSVSDDAESGVDSEQSGTVKRMIIDRDSNNSRNNRNKE